MAAIVTNRFPLLWLMVCMSALCGCVPGTVVPVAGLAGLDIAAFHRSVPDMVYSAVTGRDCSIVRLDRDESYCKPPPAPLPPQPYCTRSLGGVDCWAAGADMPNQAPQLAQGRYGLTPEQQRWQTAPWPASLTAR